MHLAFRSKALLGLASVWVSLFATSAFAAEEVSVSDAPTATHQYQLMMISSYHASYGQFGPDGTYESYPQGSSVWSVFNAFRLACRFTRDWEVDAGFSVRESQSTYPTGNMSSFGVGSPNFGTTYHFSLWDWAHGMAHFAISFPWSFKSAQMAGDPSSGSPNDDFTSGMMSGFATRTGVGLVKRLPYNFRTGVDASVQIPFAQDTDTEYGPPGEVPYLVRRGISYMANEGLSYIINTMWSANLGLQQVWSGDSYVNNGAVIGTAGRYFGSSIGVSYEPEPDWRFNGSYQTSFPFYAYSVNQAYSPTFSVALVYSGI